MRPLLEVICAELEAEADAKWPRPSPPPLRPPTPEMSDESFRLLMRYWGYDRGRIITVAGKDPRDV